MQSLTQERFIERQLNCYTEIHRLFVMCEAIKNNYLFNLKDFDKRKVVDIKEDNIIIFLGVQLVKNKIISQDFYNSLLSTSYEHAGFQLFYYLQENNYFNEDSTYQKRTKELTSFYTENFGNRMENKVQETKTTVIDIIENNSPDWFFGEIEDIIVLAGNILQSSKMSSQNIPEYILKIPSRMYNTQVLDASEYNILQKKLEKTQNLAGFTGILLYHCLTHGKFNGNAQIHQSACIYLKVLLRYVPKKDADYINGEIGRIMENFSQQQYMLKLTGDRDQRRKEVYVGFLQDTNFAQKHITQVYEFLQDLENMGYISRNEHLKILESHDISQILCIGLLQSLVSGEYGNNLGNVKEIIKKLGVYFQENESDEAWEMLENIINGML